MSVASHERHQMPRWQLLTVLGLIERNDDATSPDSRSTGQDTNPNTTW